MNNLTKQQKQAFDKFSKLKIGALFMQMGTGKTRVAIELADYNNCDLLIYIAPFSTLKNIEDEFKKWNLKTKYILIGYETISMSDIKFVELLEKINNKKCFVIADESIFIKNEETKRFKRLLKIREKCKYALIINGTPLTKNEWDLYNQMFFLSPKIIDLNRNDFLKTFFKKITYKKRNERENTFYKFSKINAKYLYELIEPYIFKCDLLFNKKEKENIFFINYNGEEYIEEKEKMLQKYINKGDSEIIINLLQNLNVIASTYIQKNDKIIKYIKNKKVIVFCNYLKEFDYISSKIDCYKICGLTKKREKVIEKFKNDDKPLIMMMGIGSYSLNLQFCNEIVYSSLTFDFAKIEQSKYRIKRIGQKNNIKYTYFLTDLGINKLILENINRKQTLENLIKEKMIKGGDLEWIKKL